MKNIFKRLTRRGKKVVILCIVVTLCICFAGSDFAKTLHYIATTDQPEYVPLQFQECDYEAKYIFADNNQTIINKNIRFCNPIASEEVIPHHIKITFDESDKSDMLPIAESTDYATFNVPYETLLSTKFHIVVKN